MKQKHRKKPELHKQIARERITELFKQAEIIFREYPHLSNRYVELARKIAMKYKVQIPRNLKKKFCKNCFRYLVPSVNCRVRLNKGKVVYYCFGCKNFMRFPYKKK